MYAIVLVARATLALVFGAAGISKLLAGFAASRKALRDFGVPQWLVAPASILLPLTELLTAFLLLAPRTGGIASIVALTLLLIFTGAVATNLALGRTPSCNCFGQLHSKPISWSAVARNGALAAVAGWIAWEIPQHPDASVVELLQQLSLRDATAISIALILFGGIAVEGFALLHVLRQNGRLLLRIEALETRAAIPQPQMQPRPALHGLPVGSKAVPFELPNVSGARASLDTFLDAGKPVLLISTDPNCGPCNALMPDVAKWQKSLSPELTIVLLSHGKYSDNKSKVAEYGLENVVLEKSQDIAAKYEAIGTPTAVLIRPDGTIGSPAMGGADAIRQLVVNKAWTEMGFVAFMSALGYPPPPPPPKPLIPIGSKAPEFALADLYGQKVHSSTFNGTGTVLLFWNPQCGFCQRMLDELKQWELRKADGAPRLMLVSTGGHEANRSMGLTSTILLDDKFEIGRLYGASGTPSAIRIDSKTKIASVLAVGERAVMELLSADNSAIPLAKMER